ncbi:formate dehydrogenase [Aurantimonas sp. A2-1-M11]|uniref:formate dehydrogenase n=1 Tax=Aurantimonas sp. A2-1-M11 TaxID=3113712 RepID=UPI002F93003A
MATDKPDLNRRAFLRKATGAAGAMTAVAVTAPAFVDDAAAYDPGDDETRTKYQPDSPDVQAFYRTNGYETLQDN